MLGNTNFLAFGLDSGSDEEERESAEDQGEDSLDLNVIKFLSRSVRTRSGRVISLSRRALAWYQLPDQHVFERSSAATHLCLRPRSPVAGFSYHAQQTRPLFAFVLSKFYDNNTIVIYSKWCRVTG